MSRTNAADDFDTIRSRMWQIEAEKKSKPQCLIPARPLYVHDCLRSPQQCPEACPLRGDWLGPQP
jgi:hypothetical protein